MAPTEQTNKERTIVKFDRLQKLDSIYGSLLKDPMFSQTKLHYAFKRFVQKNISFFNDYNEALHDIRIDNALVDPTTNAVLTDKSPRGYLYSKEGLKKLLKEEKVVLEKFKDMDCDVEVYKFSGDLEGFNLDSEDVEVLTGLII